MSGRRRDEDWHLATGFVGIIFNLLIIITRLIFNALAVLFFLSKRSRSKAFSIPPAARFEHTLIVAGSGHGKTQTLQELILGNLQELFGSIEEVEEVEEEKVEDVKPEITNTTPPKRLRWIVFIIYGLLPLVWFVDLAPVLGFILALTQLRSASGTIYRSHLRNQIIVVCVGAVFLVVGVALLAVAMNNTATIVIIVAICWVAYRLLKGVYYAIREQAYPTLKMTPKKPSPKPKKEAGGSVIVVDSQGDLIRTVSHLAQFSPARKDNINERLILIDPNDVENPPCLNLFDFGLDRLEGYSAVEREKMINGAIALYEYLFGALLGAELSHRQGVIFRYLARLMMVVPGATIHTFMNFMQEPELTRPYLSKLDPTTRRFFETQFYSKSFDDTRQQILTRLWGVISNSTLERMFANPHNKVNIFEAMNNGSVILINTAKDLLKQEGCEIFGRFFIALIAQATQERSALPDGKRRPVYLYIDECYDYFSKSDRHLESLLISARKYWVGLTLAMQHLDQLDIGLRSTVLANTATKMVGGVSAKDAAVFAKEMRCDAEFIQAMTKGDGRTQFACFVKNYTPEPISTTVAFGAMEDLPRMSDAEYQKLLEQNRERYCAQAIETHPPQPPEKQPQRVDADDANLL